MSSGRGARGNKGFSNKAKSGSKAATSRWQQSVEKAKLERAPHRRKRGKKR